jgi:hypothetical protein
MTSRYDLGLGGHLSSQLHECDNGTGKSYTTCVPVSEMLVYISPSPLPINTPKYPDTMCSVDRSVTSVMTLPILVKTAARPTTECKAATVWGKSVGVILRPITIPDTSSAHEKSSIAAT